MKGYVPRRIEGYRILRSDGKPNFTNRVYRVEKDMELLARRPPITATSTTPVIDALEKMYKHNVRSLIITHSSNLYEGVLLVEHLIDYLGGGELHDIVINRLDNDFHKAMNEPIKTIMDRDYMYVYTDYKLPEVISTMVENDLSLVPVLRKDKTLYGVISEHDIVNLLAEKRTGVRAREIMSTNIVTVESMDPLITAFNVMVRTKLRRVFVKNEVGQIVGVINANKIIEYFGSHQAYKNIRKGYLEDALSIPIKELMGYNVIRVGPDEDMGDVASKMLIENVGAVIVSEDDKDIGMITEHDVFFVLAVPLER